MKKLNRRKFLVSLACGVGGALAAGAPARIGKVQAMERKSFYLPIVSRETPPLNAAPPSTTVRLVFIHHSTGQNWLADDHGQLGITLRDNNYFVSDTNYGWGPDSIGSNTDIGNWYNWFLSGQRSSYLPPLFAANEQWCSYSRLAANPGGENQVILFKSCFPNSTIYGSPTEVPTTGTNPIYGKGAGDASYTVGNVKGLYNALLAYFATMPQKLWVLIAPPPLAAGDTNASQASNARAVNNWLYTDWLKNYTQKNVMVFDFYHVLTSNGGNNNTNDVNALTGNHHRFRNDVIEHSSGLNSNVSAYASSSGDSHPTPAGGQKASVEFIKLLNIAYHQWKGQKSPHQAFLRSRAGRKVVRTR
jgi:hypothetical protein